MNWWTVCFISLLLSSVGCLQKYRSEEFYVSVTLRNQTDTTLRSVAIGDAEASSRFGLLGAKGAGKGAVVPLRFVADLPISWEEGSDGRVQRATVDIRHLAGANHITLTYQGNRVWMTKKDDGK